MGGEGGVVRIQREGSEVFGECGGNKSESEVVTFPSALSGGPAA